MFSNPKGLGGQVMQKAAVNVMASAVAYKVMETYRGQGSLATANSNAPNNATVGKQVEETIIVDDTTNVEIVDQDPNVVIFAGDGDVVECPDEIIIQDGVE